MQCCTLPYKRFLFHDMCLYQVMTLHFLYDVANGAESAQITRVELWSVIVAFSDHTHLLYVDLSCLYILWNLFYKLILFYLYMQYVPIVYRICRIDVS